MDYIKEVKNGGDYHEVSQEQTPNTDIDAPSVAFWSYVIEKQALDWYYHGNIYSKSKKGKVGSDLLNIMMDVYIDIIKKYMRENNQTINQDLKDMLEVLKVMHKSIIRNSVDTVSANENTLHFEQVLAYLNGTVTGQIETIKDLYE